MLNFVVAGANSRGSRSQASLRISCRASCGRGSPIFRSTNSDQPDSLRGSRPARIGQPVPEPARLRGEVHHGQPAHPAHYKNAARIRHARGSGAQHGRANFDTHDHQLHRLDPPPLIATLPFERDRSGRVITDEFCRVKGSQFLWAGGDCAAVPRSDGSLLSSAGDLGDHTGSAGGDQHQGHPGGRQSQALSLQRPRRRLHARQLAGGGAPQGHPALRTAGYLSWRGFVVAYLPLWEKKIRLIVDWLIAPFVGRDLINMNVHRPMSVRPVIFEPGQDIVREGEVGQSLYIIRRVRSKSSKIGGWRARSAPGDTRTGRAFRRSRRLQRHATDRHGSREDTRRAAPRHARGCACVERIRARPLRSYPPRRQPVPISRRRTRRAQGMPAP